MPEVYSKECLLTEYKTMYYLLSWIYDAKLDNFSGKVLSYLYTKGITIEMDDSYKFLRFALYLP